MPKKREIRNSTAEFLTSVAEGKENGIQVLYKDETIWATQKAITLMPSSVWVIVSTPSVQHTYLCNLRPKASVVCPKASDAHHKPSDAHPKASDDKLKVIEIVATKPKTVNAKEYSRKPFTLHF